LSPCDCTGVGVTVEGTTVALAVGEGITVGVGVLKRTSLTRVGSGLGSAFIEKVPQARIGNNRVNKLILKTNLRVQSLLCQTPEQALDAFAGDLKIT
jgi:hypothetical protein